MYQKIQMFRIEPYGMRPRFKKDKKTNRESMQRSAIEVLRESIRAAGSAPHIVNPAEPILLDGMSPFDLANELQRDFKAARDKRGQRLHADTNVLLGGFASYPVPSADMKNNQAEKIKYLDWENAVLEYAKNKWGDRLRSAVRHIDEGYWHVHFFVTLDFAGGRTNLHDLHPGMQAFAAAAPKGDRKGPAYRKRRSAWTPALRKMQNEFYEQVSVRFRHARIGAEPARRMTQREMKREQQREYALIVAQQKADEIIREAEIRSQKIIEEAEQYRDAQYAQYIQEGKEFEEKQRAHHNVMLVRQSEVHDLLERLKSELKMAQELRLKVPDSATSAISDATNFLNEDPSIEP